VLTDHKATQDDILDGLDWILKESTQKDLSVIFVSGHGAFTKALIEGLEGKADYDRDNTVGHEGDRSFHHQTREKTDSRLPAPDN